MDWDRLRRLSRLVGSGAVHISKAKGHGCGGRGEVLERLHEDVIGLSDVDVLFGYRVQIALLNHLQAPAMHAQRQHMASSSRGAAGAG